MSRRIRLSVALLALGVAAPVQAQFTAAVAPKREKPPAVVAAEAQKAAQADTARRTQLTEMRAWVDSAAQAATGRPVVRPDSTPASVGDPGPLAPSAGATPSGTVALPDTATPLPLLALAGLLLVGAGAAMVRGSPAPARARGRARGARDA